MKIQFKDLTGQEYDGGATKRPDKKKDKAEKKPAENNVQKKEADGKKQTKLGIETAKNDNYSEWYSQV